MINVDGQLLGDYVRLVEDCCSKALSSGRPVCVFLRDVSAIDDAGRSLLRRLAGLGVRLHASGVYMSHLVKTLQHTRSTQRSADSSADHQEHS